MSSSKLLPALLKATGSVQISFLAGQLWNGADPGQRKHGIRGTTTHPWSSTEGPGRAMKSFFKALVNASNSRVCMHGKNHLETLNELLGAYQGAPSIDKAHLPGAFWTEYERLLKEVNHACGPCMQT